MTTFPSRAEARNKRLQQSETLPWLSSRMKATGRVTDESEVNPIAASRYLSDLAEELGGVISLSGGTIGDRLPPEFVREAARRAVNDYPHYPGVKGYRDLRVALSEKLMSYNGIYADPDDEILPTIGCQQVIDSTFRILVNPGDEVLLFAPEYASTEPAIHIAGGKVVYVPLNYDGNNWRFNFGELAKRATKKTKLLVMSNPNNPTGIVYSREELSQIADLAKALDFWVFSDEEYEYTLFDRMQHTSIASLPGMKERTVSGFSFSKPFAMTAYRIGYMVAPPVIIDHMHTILRLSIQACSAVGMRAAHAVLTGDMREWLIDNIENLQKKRNYMVDRLNHIADITCHSPQGVYFAFPDVRAPGMTSFNLAEHILREGRVSILPGSSFGPNGEGHLRVSFCPAMEQLVEGLDRLERALKAIA